MGQRCHGSLVAVDAFVSLNPGTLHERDTMPGEGTTVDLNHPVSHCEDAHSKFVIRAPLVARSYCQRPCAKIL